MKRRSWKRLWCNCDYQSDCECGMTVMCEHEDTEDGICEKEGCPIWNKKQ